MAFESEIRFLKCTSGFLFFREDKHETNAEVILISFVPVRLSKPRAAEIKVIKHTHLMLNSSLNVKGERERVAASLKHISS